MNKLHQLLAEVRKGGPEGVDLKIKDLVESSDLQGLLDIIEMSDQPIEIQYTSAMGKSEDISSYLRPAATHLVEEWLREHLKPGAGA